MATNNPDLLNAALTGAFGGSFANRSEKSTVAASYDHVALACLAYATALDALIPTIDGGASASQQSALSSLSFAAWSNRNPTDPLAASYASLAAVVKAAWTQVTGYSEASNFGTNTVASAVTDGTATPVTYSTNCTLTRTGTGAWDIQVPGQDFGLSTGSFPTLLDPTIVPIVSVAGGYADITGSSAPDTLSIVVNDDTGTPSDFGWSLVVSKV